MDGGSFLQHLEVILFVAGMLVQDEEVRAQQAYCESQVELSDDAHLGEVLLRLRIDAHGRLSIVALVQRRKRKKWDCNMHS